MAETPETMGEPDLRQLVEQLERSITKNGVRFAVGKSGGRSSNIWFALGYANDFYIGPRGIGIKISLHKSGICRLALTDKHFNFAVEQGLILSGEDAAFAKWWRPKPAPEIGASLVVVLVFPTDFLDCETPVDTAEKPLILFNPAAHGRAVEIAFFYSREPAETLEAKFLPIGMPTFRFDLDNGETVSMVVREAAFDPAVLPSTEKINSGALRLLDPDAFAEVGVERQDLVGAFWAPPLDGEPLRIIETGMITVRRNT